MKITPRHVARLAATQAVFQGYFRPDLDKAYLVNEFVKSKFQEGGYVLFDQEAPYLIDEAFFQVLALGSLQHLDQLDHTIQKALSPGRTSDRLDVATLSVLRCGTFELGNFKDIPIQVILSEYVTISHWFLSPKGPGFVNGVLSTLANTLRSESQVVTDSP